MKRPPPWLGAATRYPLVGMVAGVGQSVVWGSPLPNLDGCLTYRVRDGAANTQCPGPSSSEGTPPSVASTAG